MQWRDPGDMPERREPDRTSWFLTAWRHAEWLWRTRATRSGVIEEARPDTVARVNRLTGDSTRNTSGGDR